MCFKISTVNINSSLIWAIHQVTKPALTHDFSSDPQQGSTKLSLNTNPARKPSLFLPPSTTPKPNLSSALNIPMALHFYAPLGTIWIFRHFHTFTSSFLNSHNPKVPIAISSQSLYPNQYNRNLPSNSVLSFSPLQHNTPVHTLWLLSWLYQAQQ